MSTVWFTSDLHLGHKAVAALRGFDDSERHDDSLAYHWDRDISAEDQVWVLGDLTVGGTAKTTAALEWIRRRPGIKHLIAGNHDACHPMHRDAHKWLMYFYGPFESVQAFARRRIAGHEVLLSHFPYTGDSGTEDRATQYRLRDEGRWLLHGHTHSAFWYQGQQHPRQLHVGVDAWGMSPVPLDTIAERITEVDNTTQRG